MLSTHMQIPRSYRSSSGIGLHTVKHFVSKGAKVYFTARSEAKAQYTRQFVLSAAPQALSENLIWVSIDLSNVESVLQGANFIKSKEKKVDILGTLVMACTGMSKGSPSHQS